MITYRWVEGEELRLIEPVLKARGWASMNGKTCRALCAFENGALVGFHVLQLFPHAEPIWVDKAHRGSGIAEDLADKMMEFLAEMNTRGFMVVADSPAAVQLCEKHGMRKVSSPVYVM